MAKTEDKDVVKVDIQDPNEITLKEFMQIVVGQMFRTNNHEQYVSGQFDNGAGVAPELELKITLISIDGVSPE